MLRRFAAAAGLVAFGLVPFMGGQVAATSSTWFATSTQAMTLASATNLGALKPSTPLQISVALALRNKAALQNYIKQVNTVGSSDYGDSLTPSQFTSLYGPTTDQVQATEGYLTSQNFTNVHASSNNIYVTGNATAAQVEKAFNTSIDSFSQRGQIVYANVSAAMVPSSLQPFAVSVLGLNDIKMQFPAMKTAATPTPPPTPGVPNVPASYWALGFQKAYDATGASTGSATSIAIMAEGNVSQLIPDLRQYESDPGNVTCTTVSGKKVCSGLPQVPVTVEHVGVPSPDTSGLVEFDMDTQTSTGLAGNVKRLYIYDVTQLDDSDVALEFNTFASQDLAKAGSASFGECEYAAYLDGFMVANDESMAEAAAQGQTMFASAGDSGGFCAANGLANGVPVGEPDVNYPASSPYVVAAGGTTLLTNSDGSYDNSTAWDAGGGGPSLFEYQPYWQNGVAPPTSDSCEVQAPSCLGRDLPDIAMDADFLLSAGNFINDGTETSNGGTSLASPLALGSWARIESHNGNKIGFASPNLYAAAGSTGFHDITLGDNGPYPATPGWDFATGNGSFDIKQMQTAIVAHSAAAPHYPVPAPACNLWYDPAGDANPTASTGNVDSLDIISGGMSTNMTRKTITGVLRVKSLDDGPGGTISIAGTGDEWYFLFTYKGTTYFLNAAYDPTTQTKNPGLSSFAFNYGHIVKSPTNGSEYSDDGTATGTVSTKNGVIAISAPWSVFGSQLTPKAVAPVKGSVLSSTAGQTFEEVGTSDGGLLEGADTAGGNANYSVGTNCS